MSLNSGRMRLESRQRKHRTTGTARIASERAAARYELRRREVYLERADEWRCTAEAAARAGNYQAAAHALRCQRALSVPGRDHEHRYRQHRSGLLRLGGSRNGVQVGARCQSRPNLMTDGWPGKGRNVASLPTGEILFATAGSRGRTYSALDPAMSRICCGECVD
jgi:hypothetical protein